MKFASIFADHAVLQHGQDIVLWGWAKPDSKVEIRLAGHRAEGRANEEGSWQVSLPSLPAGGPHTLTGFCGTASQTVKDIWLGEVWLASGQSNMEWTMAMLKGKEEEIRQASTPLVRHFTVAHCRALTPPEDVTGTWEVASPESAGGFSAVAYHFARLLSGRLGIAVGMITSAWGGTEIASWLPDNVLRSDSRFADLAKRIPVEILDFPPLEFHVDEGRSPETQDWENPRTADSDWPTLSVPGLWQNQEWRFNGAVWYRREINLPESWAGRPLVLELGAIDDFDITFFNGVRVGGLDITDPNAYLTPRSYPIPAWLVGSGRAVIAVRVFDHFGGGGFAGPPSAVRIFPRDEPKAALPLAGTWHARTEREMPLRAGHFSPNPAELFYGMIAPLRRLGLRGFLWYQGESDAQRADVYFPLLKALIESWRKTFGGTELPFGLVQLTGFAPEPSDAGCGHWPALREAQFRARELPSTGVAVTLDVGDEFDIHPTDKRPVGERLAWWALATVYDQPVIFEGPILAGSAAHGEGLRLHFTGAEGLRTRDGGPVRGLEVARPGGDFVRAEATIEGKSLWLPGAADCAVRYAWHDFPVANLENAGGLPAAPFRIPMP